MHLSHPETTIPTPTAPPPHPCTPAQGKIVFHETHSWCQEDWGTLLQEVRGSKELSGVSLPLNSVAYQ